MVAYMKKLWDEVKTILQKQMPDHTYRMWIEPLEFVGSTKEVVTIGTPNLYSKKRVTGHYANEIEKQLSSTGGKPLRLAVTVSEKKGPKKENFDEPPKGQLYLPVQEEPASGRYLNSRKLRKGYTFDSFVVGVCNDFAYNASLHLAQRKNLFYKFLYLVSDSGLGKSHLSNAVGHHILNAFPKESVYYITAEDFTNEMINSFRKNAFEDFKEKYRNRCDVLLLEDIHHLAGKDRTQRELSLALDYLEEASKTIIFTSCLAPNDIPKLSPELRSRLLRSLISGIEPPDYETRLKILKQKCRELNCRLPDIVIEYMASELCDNVRQLESALTGVSLRSSLLGKPVDLALAKNVVSQLKGKQKRITLEFIKELVCRHYRITIDELTGKSRKQALVRPRQMAIYLSRRYTNQSLQAIGKSFNRYHATALRSVSAVEKGIREDTDIRGQAEILSKKIESETV